ncbi:peptidase S28 [Panaeolus papilionaceus]|nr:peptidase S28 [Panaeolus papilionaceus]
MPSTPSTEVPVTSRNGTTLPPYNTVYYFDQLIDHNNPSLGTFKQRFWHTWEFYEPGGPIVLMTPGETSADGYSGYLANRTITGMIAQQQNGSVIVLEHRFYGLSNPYPDLSVKSFRVHTIQQAIDDLEYFAKNVNLPQPDGDKVTPDRAPWVFVGGSYPGALVSWSVVNKPGLFAAGYASSAVVEAILDFWQYFEPIRLNMPANCSADVQAVISYVDKTLLSGNGQAIQKLKDNFGLGNISHIDDFAGALRNNLWDWQSLQPTSGRNTQFYRFCDALEVKNAVSAGSQGWGLDNALTAWGNYWKNGYYDRLCDDQDAETCFGTYDSSLNYWTNTTINNSNRSWFWIVCNEVGYLQEGAPLGNPSLVSRIVTPLYDMRQCKMMFPEAFKVLPAIPRTLITNAKYKGWGVSVSNVFFANGIRDPWKEATLSTTGLRPKVSSQHIGLGGGFHCSDMSLASAQADPTIAAVQAQALQFMKATLASWKPTGNSPPVKGPKPKPFPFNPLPIPMSKPINAWFRGVGRF